jgi:hypothetical protein
MAELVLWPATSGPGASAGDAPVNLGVQVRVSAQAWLVGFRFWRADVGITGAVKAVLYEVVGGVEVPGTRVPFVVSGTGWIRADLATAIELTPGVQYVAAVHFPSGLAATSLYWRSGPGSAGIANGLLSAPSEASAVSNAQGRYAYAADYAFPANGSGSAANYWVDVVVSDVEPPSGDPTGAGTTTVALVTSVAGAKRVTGVIGTSLALSTLIAGEKRAAAARTSPLTLGGTTAGESIRGSARTSTLTLFSSSTGGPVTGPIPAVVSPVLCAPWATPADVPAAIRTELGITDDQLAAQLMRASELLWMLTGRIWYGIGCSEEVTLRSLPTSAPWRGDWIIHSSWGECPCWLTPGSVVDHIAQPLRVKLPRSPVQAIISVTVEGVLLDPTAYRLNHAGVLERIDGGLWQVCGGDTVIVYTYGEAPPAGGRDAAVTLGVEFARDLHGLGNCRLPSNVTSLTRQEVTTTYADPNEFLEKGLTGLRSVDLWVKAVNPHNRPQRARVYSPDVPRTNRRSLP